MRRWHPDRRRGLRPGGRAVVTTAAAAPLPEQVRIGDLELRARRELVSGGRQADVGAAGDAHSMRAKSWSWWGSAAGVAGGGGDPRFAVEVGAAGDPVGRVQTYCVPSEERLP